MAALIDSNNDNVVSSLEKGLTTEQSHLEVVSHNDEDDFSWNYDVITNLLALYFTYFASTWALGVPGGSIPYIMAEFPTVPPAIATWIATSPSVAVAVISIFLGDISDIFGRRWFLLIAGVFGIAGSLIGSRGDSVEKIIAGQVLNGIALTLGYLSTPLLAEVVPKRWRPPIVGGGTVLVGFSGAAGGISQGAFMKQGVSGLNQGWRIGFYLGAGFWLLSFITVFLFYHPGARPNPEGLSTKQHLLKIDWTGIFLGAAGLVLALVGLQYGGNPYAWNSATVLCLLIIGFSTLIVFGLWEWKCVGEGLFPRSLFEHHNYSVTLALNFIEGMVIFISQAYIPQEIAALLTSDWLLLPVYNLPSLGGAMIGAIIVGIFVAKTREAKWAAVFGVGSLAIGCGLMAVLRPGITYAAFFFPILIIGIGVGTMGVVIPVLSTVCTPNRYIATSVSIGTSVRGLGGSIGTVIFSQIYSSKLKVNLPNQIGAAVFAAGLPLSSVPDFTTALLSQQTALLQTIPGVNPEIIAAATKAVGHAYSDSFRIVWLALIPFGVVIFGMAFLLKSTKSQLNYEVASAVENRHGVEHAPQPK